MLAYLIFHLTEHFKHLCKGKREIFLIKPEHEVK